MGNSAPKPDPAIITSVDAQDHSPIRLAVKDCIDVEGVPTTSGSAVVAEVARPAERDAVVVQRLRAAGAAVVAKTNLDELCFGSTGVNPWFGTPVNPLDPGRIPGGSSSGSAVAVATGLADVALGTDTTGSARTPAAFCGVVGLKLTRGAVPMDGIGALAPSLDCLGVLAAGTGPIRFAVEALGIGTSGPGVSPPPGPIRLARFRIPGVDATIEDAIDDAVASADARLDVREVDLAEWDSAAAATRTILFSEAPEALGPLVGKSVERLGPDVRQRFAMASQITEDDVRAARELARTWPTDLRAAMGGCAGLITAATPELAPSIDDRSPQPNSATSPISLAGLPAVVGPLRAPVAGGGVVPAVQLVGVPDGELALLDLLDHLITAAEPAGRGG